MKNDQNKDTRRWDRIIGIVTLIVVVICAMMVFIDFKKLTKADVPESVVVDDDMSDFLDEEKEDFEEESVMDGNGIEGETQQSEVLEEELETEEPKNFTVCIDPAKGGTDTGVSNAGKFEKDVNLEIAQKAQVVLQRKGFNVVLTRNSDVSMTPDERVDVSNNAAADLVITIQVNSSSDATKSGSEFWIHKNKPKNAIDLAENFMEQFENWTTLISDGEVKSGTIENPSDNYYINGKTKCVSCMVMPGYITNSDDCTALTTNNGDLVNAIADGISEYYDLIMTQ